VKNEHCIYEEIKRRLNSGNTCYNSDVNVPVTYLKNLKIKIHKINIASCFALRIFLSLVIRKGLRFRMFGCKREGVPWVWRKLHDKLYYSPDNIRVSKPRSMRWMGHEEGTEEKRNAYEILWEIA
jgi:hypothetical protein